MKETVGKNVEYTVKGDMTFKVGSSTVKVCQNGTVEIKGVTLNFNGTTVNIKGSTVNISGGSGDCKINGISLVNHKHTHSGAATAGPYVVAGETGTPTP